jgi:hypothetical protein
MQYLIVPSARKHGVPDEDMLHALRNHIYDRAVDDEGMTMLIGPARDGELIEVGVVDAVDFEGIVIAHAFRPARPKFLPRR